jgi:ubiquinone biosynthesis protein UbiJ
MNWLFDNLRWEPFDDLARWWGDATASELARTANAASDGVRRVGAWVSTVLTRFLSEGSGGRKEF